MVSIIQKDTTVCIEQSVKNLLKTNMNPIMSRVSPPYIIDDLKVLTNKIKISPSIFIGSLGFEVRCLSATMLLESSQIVSRFIFVSASSGDTKSKRHDERLARHSANKDKLEQTVTKEQYRLIQYNLTSTDDTVASILEEVLKIDYYRFVIIDFSTMPKSVFFPLMKGIWNSFDGHILAVYTVPEEYTKEPLFFETTEPRILSGFIGKNKNYDIQDAWIPILGFEGQTAISIMSWGSFKKVLPIIAFPGYRAHYVDRVAYSNKELLSLPETERVYFSTANNPFRAEHLISRLVESHADYNIVLSPMGPKPHSLGVCLAALKSNLRVVYAQPWDYNPNYSSGSRSIQAYLLK